MAAAADAGRADLFLLEALRNYELFTKTLQLTRRLVARVLEVDTTLSAGDRAAYEAIRAGAERQESEVRIAITKVRLALVEVDHDERDDDRDAAPARVM